MPFSEVSFKCEIVQKNHKVQFFQKWNRKTNLSESSPSMTTGERSQVNVSLTYGSYGGYRPGKLFS